MMFKSKLVIVASALMIASSGFAVQKRPEACPVISAIQTEGMDNAQNVVEGMYLTYHFSQYNTPDNWAFIMGVFAGESEEDAIIESNQLLSRMSGSPIPEKNDEDVYWTCQYETHSPEISAFAVQVDSMISPFRMSHFLRKAR